MQPFLKKSIMTFKEYIPFYKRNLKVAIPVVITQAGQVAVNLADNIMVGHLGAAELAGVSFANAVFMIGMVFCLGFTQGVTPIVGQHFGKNEKQQCEHLPELHFHSFTAFNYNYCSNGWNRRMSWNDGAKP